MTFDLDSWLKEIVTDIKTCFDKRVLFIGYQGSYKRGEATDTSDIDMVVILDKVTLDDLKLYRKIVQNLSHSEKACGFLGGKKEVLNWPKSDIFHLIHDTEPLFGSLENLVPEISKQDIKLAVKNGAANIYHAAVHSFLYDKDKKTPLEMMYKGTFFVLQALIFLNTGSYISTKKELFDVVQNIDKEILKLCINRKNFTNYNTEQVEDAYKKLIEWSSALISEN